MKRKNYKGIFMLVILCATGLQDCAAQLNYDYVYKYAGNGTGSPGGVGGLATSRRAVCANGLATDNQGNVYMGESNQIIKIDAKTGITSVVAGNGTLGFSGDGGIATAAEINSPLDIAFDNRTNEMYFIDQFVGGGAGGSVGAGNRIRKVSGGIITTVAGTGTIGHSGDGGLATTANISARSITIASDSRILIAEPFYIREISGGVIHTIAGSGASPYTISGSGGPALSANIDIGGGQIVCDSYGSVYFSETQWQIVRKVDIVSGTISRVAGVPPAVSAGGGAYSGDGGPATSARLFFPLDIVFDGFGNMYINDNFNFVIRKVTPGGTISTIAGNNISATTGLAAACNHPKSTRIGTIGKMAIDPDNYLYLYNQQNPVIWKLSDGLRVRNIDLNTTCIPGASTPPVTPAFSVMVKGGVPPYTYNWAPLSGNNAVLSSTASGAPTIVSISAPYQVKFYLMVMDNSSCGNIAMRQTQVKMNDNQTFDLAMRDSYLDMYDEPNSQSFGGTEWDPDIWNREFPDDRVNINQDVCYGTPCDNHMYVTVRNVGCLASSGGESVKMYWTVGGTTQTWPGNWTSDTYMGAGCSCPLPQGEQIADISLLPMLPGTKLEYKRSWTPPDPALYSGTNDMGICFQGRIVDHHHPSNTDGMTFEESMHVFGNMASNNNIVLRNSKVVRINNIASKKWTVVAGNAKSAPAPFSLKFLNGLLGTSTLSQYAEITVYLGDIYDLWVAGGSLGTYQQINPVAKTVTFNGTNEIVLDGIQLPANSQYLVDVEFALKPGVDGTEMRTEYVYFQQLLSTQQGPELYGSFEFIVTYDGENPGPFWIQTLDNQENPAQTDLNIKVFPNPASATVNFEFPAVAENGTIVLVDVSGHEVARQTLKNQKTSNFDVKLLAPGVYIYRIHAADMIQSGTVIVEK